MLQGDEKTYRQAMVNYMVYIMPEITDALFETYAAGVELCKGKEYHCGYGKCMGEYSSPRIHSGPPGLWYACPSRELPTL